MSYIPGKKNVLADQFSRPYQVLTDGSFLPQVFDSICKVFNYSHTDLFATRANASFVCVSGSGPQGMEARCFQHPYNDLGAYVFTTFAILSQALSRVRLSRYLSLVLVAHFWPQTEWFTDLLAPLVEKPINLPLLLILLVQPCVISFTGVWKCCNFMRGS